MGRMSKFFKLERELYPETNEPIIEKTFSVSPEYRSIVPAYIVEGNDGKAYLVRRNSKGGQIRDLYWSDAKLLREVQKYKTFEDEDPLKCPNECATYTESGLCDEHKSKTALANLVATNRCDLSCWYCFFYAERAGYVYEPSLDEIKNMLRFYKAQDIPMAVQITGGEPLLREDLVDIVKLLKEEGVSHVQINTDGIRFSYDGGGELVKRLKDAGANTLYLSFDGVKPKTNPKNHWEIPYILENIRKGGLRSIVLVPTVIRGVNENELGDMIRFAAYNNDVVRGVNFQPVSLVGMLKKKEIEDLRVTIPDVLKAVEEQTNGEIAVKDWKTVPYILPALDFLEKIKEEEITKFTNHPDCGMATYVYVDKKKMKFTPVTRFIDVDSLMEDLGKSVKRINESMIPALKKYYELAKLLYKLEVKDDYIIKENLPKGLNIKRELGRLFSKPSYESAGELHYDFLYLGIMHFMDFYNYNLQRLMRCNIHYLTQEGLVPFCAFNVLEDLYRDYFQRKYSTALDQWEREHGKTIKYVRDRKKLESGEIYKKTYERFKEN